MDKEAILEVISSSEVEGLVSQLSGPSVLNIVAIALSLATAGAFLYQLVLLRQQVSDDHERSRRENAVVFILKWASSLKLHSRNVIQFVEKLNGEQCQQLANVEAFEIRADLREEALECLSGLYPEQSDVEKEIVAVNEDRVKVSKRGANYIRWTALSYLNELEAILLSWKHNVSDQHIIRQEFEYLVAPASGKHVVHEFRVALDVNSFPAIRDFVEYLNKRHIRHTESREKTGRV